MRITLAVTLMFMLLNVGCSQNHTITAQGTRLVNLAKVDPTLIIDSPYATSDNFVGIQMYPKNEIWLEEGTAEKLMSAQASLRKQGLGLKVLDGYRPLEIQRTLWKILPDPRYVANPERGSRHNRGCAVDVTLVDAEGDEMAMPTEFDEFSERAGQDYQNLPQEVLKNRKVLNNAMRNAGFTTIRSEWWHFDAVGWEDFPILDINPYDEPLFPNGTEGMKIPANADANN